MKTIIQDEISECGLACVAMIASHYGRSATLPELRRHYKVDRNGLSLYDLECIFSELDIVACSYELDFENLKELDLPAIIQWQHNHFVVLSKVTKKSIEVYDPAVGRKRYINEMAKSMFSGYAINVEKAAPINKSADSEEKPSIFKSAIKVKGVKVWLSIFSIASIFSQIFSLMTPKYMSLTIDKVLAVNDENLLFVISLGFFFIYTFDFCSQLISNEIKLKASYEISRSLSVLAYKNLANQSLGYFQSRHVSDLTKRLSLLAEYGSYLVNSYITTTINLSFAAIFGALIALINPTSFFVVATIAIIFFVVRMLYVNKLELMHSGQIAYEANRNEVVLNLFSSIKSIKIAGQEFLSIKEMVKFNNKQLKNALRGIVITDDGATFYTFCNNICTIAITILFATTFLQGKEDTATIGNFFIIFFYKEFFFQNIAMSAEAILNIFKAKPELEHAATILFAPGEYKSTSVILDRDKTIRSIQIENGQLTYTSFGDPVFTNLNITLAEREKIALVGKSGSGKTSLLTVLSSLTRLDQGNFLVNGIALDKYGIVDYRKSIGVYFAEETLKNTSVLKNITEDENYDEDHLHHVLNQVGLIDEINAMHAGFNTLLGQGGTQLSSGQQQRLMIARELYKRPDILLLDEPTSHIDKDNTRLIAQAIHRFDGICLVISHDEELLSYMDKVYQFESMIHA